MGGLITTRADVLIAVPSTVVTLTLPVIAVEGMVAVTDVAEDVVTETGIVPIFTVGSVLPTLRLNPVTVKESPTIPPLGVTKLILGVTLKLPRLAPGPA